MARTSRADRIRRSSPFELDLGTAVLRVHDPVALLDVHREKLPGVRPLSGPHGQDGALLGLFLGRVGDHETRDRGLLPLLGANEDAVVEGLNRGLRRGGHTRTSWGLSGLLALLAFEC
jgi:hypothetical protein